MPYIYETHLHTCQASRCGRADGADYPDYMTERGFAGFIVTDHFFNGNSAVPRDLPWPERVAMYMSGYRAALKAAEGKDISVFFGIEFNFEGDEFLLYGVGEKWLLENPDMLSWTRKELYDSVHACGGIVIQAHPYRERDYLSRINLTPAICDGIEICNIANPPYQNALGYEYAKKLGVPMTAGSDIHAFYDGPMAGMQFERKLESVEDYAAEVMAGRGTPVIIDRGIARPVTDFPEQITVSKGPTLPVITHEV